MSPALILAEADRQVMETLKRPYGEIHVGGTGPPTAGMLTATP